MLTKAISYTDYNGEKRIETFMFNLTKAELLKMDLAQNGSLKDKLEEMVNNNDTPALTKFFDDLILNSYGKKSDDGRRFIKTPEMRAEFEQSEAYSELFIELLQNEKAATAFITGIMPPDLVDTKAIPMNVDNNTANA